MFCRKCGYQLKEDDKFCPKCGEKVENIFEEDNKVTSKVEEEKKQTDSTDKDILRTSEQNKLFSNIVNKRKIIIGALFGIITVALLLTLFVRRSRTINLNSFITAEFYGYDGYGSVYKKVDNEKIIASGKNLKASEKEIEKAINKGLEDENKEAIYYIRNYSEHSDGDYNSAQSVLCILCDEGEFETNEGISNGDTIRYHWYVSDELISCLEDIYNINIKYSDIDFIASGLDQPETSDSEAISEGQVEPYYDYEVDTSPTVTMIDDELERCILDSFGIEDGNITEKMCDEITVINADGYVITTLEDLEHFQNLNELYIDNQDNELNLKGINKAPSITTLTLRNCKLSEVDRIAELSNLEYLDISTDYSWGSTINDYSSLSGLTKLKTLNMGWYAYNEYNDMNLVDASFINSLKELENLNLYETGVCNYDLSYLPNLKRLIISECDMREIFTQLDNSGALKTIQMLDVSACGLTDNIIMNYFPKAKSLKELYINIGGLTKLKGLDKLTNLNYLYIVNGGAYGIPMSEYNYIGKLKGLVEFRMSEPPAYHTPEDTFVGNLDFIGGMENLKYLDIAPVDEMSFDSISNLKNLETITLRGSTISDENVDISSIGKLTSLKTFRYCETRFKSTAPLDDLDYLYVEEFNLFGDEDEDLNEFRNRFNDIKDYYEFDISSSGESDDGSIDRGNLYGDNSAIGYLLDVEELKVGDYVNFGRYEQDGYEDNGMEQLEWEVVCTSDSSSILMSKYMLLEKPYNEDSAGEAHLKNIWKTSTLRKWLNNDFYNVAFNDEEKSIIGNMDTTVNNDTTEDKVFLLSGEEAQTFWGACYYDPNSTVVCFDEELVGVPTDACGRYADCWWLRSDGPYDYTAEYIDDAGQIYYADTDYWGGYTFGVRPCICVNK